MSTTPSNDTTARVSGAVLGIIIFLIGVALIGYVFMAANRLFNEPPPQISTASVSTPAQAAETGAATAAAAAAAGGDAGAAVAAPSPAVMQMGATLTQFVKQVLVLIVMCIAGSVIASKGIQLFFASRSLASARSRPDPD